jgi:signal transduction histidine kinase/ligand-binding sensor domain-containing protein
VTHPPVLRLIGLAVAAALMACAAATAQVSAPAPAPVRLAGEYRSVGWTAAEGLPQNTVTDILQLPNGELWVATFGGLARFDGFGFRVIDMASDEGLPANRIVALAPAGRDAFWFLSQQGHLGKVEGGRATPVLPPPIPGHDTLDFAVDQAGRVFCRPVDGSVWVYEGTGRWRPVVGASRRIAGLRQLAVTDDGEIWVVRGERLIRVTADGVGRESEIAPGRYHRVFPRQGDGLWVALDRGLAEMHDGRIEVANVHPPIEQQVTFVRQGDDRTVWVASLGDVSRLTREPDGAWSRASLPAGSAGASSIRSMLLDDRGSLWLGSSGGGLHRVSRPSARRFGPESGFAAALALAPDGSGGAFVARECRGVVHVDPSGAVSAVALKDRSGTRDVGDEVCAIALGAGPGVVWARADNLLYQIRTGARAVSRVRVEIPDDNGPVVANPDGTAWVVSRTGPVHLVAPDGRVLQQRSLPPPLMSASIGPDGALWLGGDGQVFRVDRRAIARFGASEGVPRGLVRDVVAEPGGTVWIGSYGGGLGRLRDGRVARLTVEEGLPDNSVSRILDDGHGRMWILTNRGLAVVSRTELDAAADGRVRAMMPVVMGAERGVVEANFGSPAGFVGGDGRLWYGTIEGIGVIDAAAFPFNATPPVVRIEGVWADGRLLPAGPEVRIPPSTTRVRLGFTVLELLNPESVRFRFRVGGLDTGWVDLGSQRFVDWSAPGPGRYRVLVEARNEDGVWSAAPAAIALYVLPAWWQTTAIRSLGVLAVLLAGLLAYRLRVRSIEQRHAQRVRVMDEQRQAAERVAELRSQLEHVSRVALAGELAASLAHEVSQPLGAIVNNAEAGRRNLDRYLQRPGQLGAILDDIVADGMRASEVVRGLRRYLRPRDAPFAPVDLSRVVRDALPLVSRELRNNRVAVALLLADGLPPVEASSVQLGQVVMNLVMNACEALAGVEGERRIALTTAARDGRVELSVRDNGPGMAETVAARAFEPFVTTKPDGLGMGLAICRGVAEAHGGTLAVKRPPYGGLEVLLSLPAVPAEVPGR